MTWEDCREVPSASSPIGRVLPLSRSILAAVAIFVFIGVERLLWPFIITTDPSLSTLPVGPVQSSFGVRYAQVMASAILAGPPLDIVLMLFQRQIIRGMATTGLGGSDRLSPGPDRPSPARTTS